MKCNHKVAAVLTALTLTAALTACGESVTSTDSKAPMTGTIETSDPAYMAEQSSVKPGTVSYAWKINGTEIAINADADAIVKALGEPKSTFDAPSCAFEGTSYTYTYDGFTIETYPQDNLNKVYAVTLTDATVQTNEGVKVGDTLEAVTAVCGEPSQQTAAYASYNGEGVALQFFLEGGKVTSIVYTYKM